MTHYKGLQCNGIKDVFDTTSYCAFGQVTIEIMHHIQSGKNLKEFSTEPLNLN